MCGVATLKESLKRKWAQLIIHLKNHQGSGRYVNAIGIAQQGDEGDRSQTVETWTLLFVPTAYSPQTHTTAGCAMNKECV